MKESLPLVIIPLLLAWLLSSPQSSTSLLSSTQFQDTATKILLLTAHPDDEVLFFAPTILALTSQKSDESTHTQIFAICLSTGNAEGHGTVRKDEFHRSLDILGIPQSNRRLIENP